MATHLSALLKNTAPWLTSEGEMADVAIASLGRLVRNLPGHPFPGWSTEESRRAVVDSLLPTLLARNGFKTAFHADMAELSLEQRRLLLERKLITPCMAARQSGCHVIIPRKQNITIMLNEEEHLVVHFFRQGLDLRNVLIDLQQFAASLEKDISFAHDDAHGYLTSLPAEAGDGIQLYVVLHLPALTMADTAEQITRGLEKLNANIAPLYTGLQEDTGNTYVLFTNAIARGDAENAISQFEDVANMLILREIQMRTKLMEENPFELADRIGRAFGQLCYAMKLGYREMLDSLSLLRLGHQCGMFSWEQPERDVLANLAALNIELAPIHLSRQDGGKVPPAFHPVLRAMRIKEILMEAGPNFTSPYTTLEEPS